MDDRSVLAALTTAGLIVYWPATAEASVRSVRGEKSFGTTMTVVMRAAATDVREQVIPNSGHWLMEEQPDATVAAVRAFLDTQR